MAIYGQPQRRGFNLRWLILLGFAAYAAISWMSSKKVDPYTGAAAHYGATPEEEAQLGAQAYAQVLGDAQQQNALEPASDQASQQVRAIAQRLIARVPQVAADLAAEHGQPTPDLSNYQWDVNVIQSQEANAFCLPGGKIAVYTGILPVARNADALAIVLGHEISHALLRHGAQRMAQQKLVQLGQTAVGMSGVDQNTMAALGAGLQYGVVLPYSRNQESQADEVGLMLAAAACYDPAQAVPLWQRMGQLDGGQRTPEFASDHPDPANRMQALQDLQPRAQAFHQKYCSGSQSVAMQ